MVDDKCNENLTHFVCQLKLSVEHSGFTFEKDPQKAMEMLHLHSGGKVAEALKKAVNIAKE